MSSASQAAIAVYEEAVQLLERQEMYQLYALFLQKVLAGHAASKPHTGSTADVLCSVYQRAAEKGTLA